MNPLSGLYGRVATLRRAWYERHPDRRRRLSRPVISVGNLVVGGSGKTPTVAAIARLLVANGEKPAILTRGYARRAAADGVVVVSDSERVLEPVARSGDEAQMLARGLPGVPVLVSPNRFLAGRLAERRFGSTVHLLDDGFQHLQLARTTDLLIVAKADLTERLLPSGRLREPLDAARGADALLVAGTEADADAVAGALGGRRVFRIIPKYQALCVVSDPSEQGIPDPGSARRRIVAVAAIARPERFFDALRAEGWEVARQIVFRDHHWFSPRDLDSIRREAEAAGADLIVTTEKDAMRLDPDATRLSRYPLAFLPMQIAIEPQDAFVAWLKEQLAAARASRAMEAA